jgi:hypothetical protein
MQEVVEFFASGPSRERIAAFRLSDSAQEHIRALLTKNSAATLTTEEERELDMIMALNDMVTLIRVRAQQTGNVRSSTSPSPSDA